MKHNWGEFLLNDPAYSPNLTLIMRISVWHGLLEQVILGRAGDWKLLIK